MTDYAINGAPAAASVAAASVAAADITDSTATGRALLTAEDAAAALAVVGAEAAGAAAAAQAAAEAASVPTSRTVAGVSLAGDITAATLRTALGVPPVADVYAGPFSSTAYLGGEPGAAEPSIVPGRSLVVTFWKTANVASEQEIVSRLDATPARGWVVGVLAGGSFYGYMYGPGATTLGSFNALSVGIHAIAITVHDDGSNNFTYRYSIDGGAVATASGSGAVTAADSTTALCLGRQVVAPPNALTSADLLQVQTFSTEVSDADLILLSAANALPRVAVGTGTVAFDWLAPRDFWPGYAESITGAGSQRWTLPVVGTLTRRRHS